MSSHYYTPDTLELIDGDLRAARKVGGLPSPSTVLKMLSSPGLQYYFKRQMFESAVTTPRTPGETDDDYFDRCCRYADEHGKTARDAGSDFHAIIQQFHLWKIGKGRFYIEANHPLFKQVKAYIDWYNENVKQTILVEHRVRGHGYAGRLDHLAELRDDRICCMDGKTQDITKKGVFTYYSEFGVQLGGYGGTLLGTPFEPDILMSVCVSRGPVAVVEAYVWPKPPSYYHNLFLGLLAYWRELHDYHE